MKKIVLVHCFVLFHPRLWHCDECGCQRIFIIVDQCDIRSSVNKNYCEWNRRGNKACNGKQIIMFLIFKNTSDVQVDRRPINAFAPVR